MAGQPTWFLAKQCKITGNHARNRFGGLSPWSCSCRMRMLMLIHMIMLIRIHILIIGIAICIANATEVEGSFRAIVFKKTHVSTGGQPWLKYGSILSQVCIKQSSSVGPGWAKCGSSMGQVWVKGRSCVGQTWAKWWSSLCTVSQVCGICVRSCCLSLEQTWV